MTDTQTTFTAEEIARLIAGLGQLLESDSCRTLCPDYEEERGELAGIIAHWLLSDKAILISPYKILPRAKYKLAFNVVDEATGEHIVRVSLDRSREMADGDFLQMQNFFWVTIGRAIRDNPEIIKTLRAGGIGVETDPKQAPGAPGAMHGG